MRWTPQTCLCCSLCGLTLLAAVHARAAEPSAQEHWAYRPVTVTEPPGAGDSAWPGNDIDRFVLARLEAAGLKPATDASPEALVRRLFFDLIGLPPTPEEIDEFVSDSSDDAYRRLVERLLASPRFGQRWARHWLDVARFGESLTLRGMPRRHCRPRAPARPARHAAALAGPQP